METVIVNEKTYELKKLGGLAALALQVRVTKLVGGALGGIGKINAKDLTNIMKMDVVDIIKNIGGVLENVDEDKFIALMLELVSSNILLTKYAGDKEVKVPLKVDDLEIMEIYELAFKVLELNLGKFIGDIKSRFNSLQDSKKNDS